MAEPGRPVCVLGMMRTGTSLVAALLEALGVSFGGEEDLIPPNRANPTGFREHRGIVALNDRLLERAGGAWYDPPALPDGWTAAALAAEGEAAGRIVADLAARGPWGWKDPRTCLTLDFWRALADPAAYVVCLRDPAETARSLLTMPWAARRLGEDPDRPLDLWLRYTRAALTATEDRPRLLLFYEDVLADPHAATARLAALVGRPATPPRAAVDALARGDLRHHHAGTRSPRHPAEALYFELRAAETTG